MSNRIGPKDRYHRGSKNHLPGKGMSEGKINWGDSLGSILRGTDSWTEPGINVYFKISSPQKPLSHTV